MCSPSAGNRFVGWTNPGLRADLAVTDSYCGKLLYVRAGEALSLQLHQRKDETIYVHQGRAEIELGTAANDTVRVFVTPGESLRLRPGLSTACAQSRTRSFEVSTPELDDVVRLEDRYGRD